MVEPQGLIDPLHLLVAKPKFVERLAIVPQAGVVVEDPAVAGGRRLVLGSLEIEIADFHHVVRKASAQSVKDDLTFLGRSFVGVVGAEEFQIFERLSRGGLIAINRFDLIVVAERGPKDRVGNLGMLGVKVGESTVIGEGFVVVALFEVGVRDLDLGFDLVFAVGVVVDDCLEGLPGSGVVDPGINSENVPALQEFQAFGVELVGGGDILKAGRVRGATGRQGQHEGQGQAGEGFFRARSSVHGGEESTRRGQPQRWKTPISPMGTNLLAYGPSSLLPAEQKSLMTYSKRAYSRRNPNESRG